MTQVTVEIAGLLLTPGAGGGADHHTLVALEAELDVAVRRVKVPQRTANAAAVNLVAEQTRQLGCELAQEYHFARPPTSARLRDMLRRGLDAAAA